MRTRITLLTLIFTVCCFGSVSAMAGGFTADKLERAGFVCFPAGPSNWIHCLHADKIDNENPSVPVKVFSDDGSVFLGTELLLHEDIYAGQPCPQDDLDLWEPQPGIPYMACHHFLTGHH